MDLSQYAELFLAESREHLGTVNQLLIEWEQHPEATEPVGGIFRAVHTIKGMAATMGYRTVADLAHRTESLLDLLRGGARTATAETLELLFQAADALQTAIEASAAGREGQVDVNELLQALDAAAEDADAGGEPARRRPSAPIVMPQIGAGRVVRVTLAPEAALKGARALLILKRLETLGTVHSVAPAPVAIEGDDFDGRFSCRVEGDAEAATIVALVRSQGDVEGVTVGQEEEVQRPDAAGGRARHIRVDLRRLDALMNLIGELVTARGRLTDLAARREDPELDDVSVKVSQLSEALQTEIIEARMTPVWQVFDRFPRLVRDLARQLGKQVSFRVEGKEIELDRAILDEIGDPLMHLLRNAVDHGIETAEERRAAGKPPEGQIVLSAVRERNAVAIRVADDGRGIDRATILRVARARGLVGEGVEHLADELLLRVLSRPGFSMAKEVSDVSGRGVGVDVVVQRLRAVGGTVQITSELAKGSTFILRLPPTLAIVRAVVTRVGTHRFALPVTHVTETLALDAAEVTAVEGRDVMVVRDAVIPLVHLRRMLNEPGEGPRGQPVIVLQIGDRRSGLVVDQVLGQQEIVLKSFDPPRGTLPIFGGATILGDGRPVLILDAGGLV
jgi:two-component system chemotaxis sensor kinase CheA